MAQAMDFHQPGESCPDSRHYFTTNQSIAMKTKQIEAAISALEAKRHNTRSFPRQMAIHEQVKALKAELAALKGEQ